MGPLDARSSRVLLALALTATLAGGVGAEDASVPFVFTVATAVGAVPLAGLVHLLVVFPGGRLTTTRERLLVYASYPIAVAANLSTILVDPTPQDNCDACPRKDSRPERTMRMANSEPAGDLAQSFR